MEGRQVAIVSGLYKSFPRREGEVQVLRGIDLEIQRGESISVVGESGAGKSTLLHVMGALELPTRGRVWINGIDLHSLEPKHLAAFRNREIGFVFQFHHLLPEFTAEENAMMPALIARQKEGKAREAAREALSDLGLSHRLDHKVGELSGGEQQRVAIARAVIMSPALLLADEPTGNLDARTGGAVEDLLLGLSRERGMTLLVVTHSERLARRMDRVVRLSDGVVTGNDVNHRERGRT
jgi:lipoprotein-releasing system ATP-binding protein